MNYSLTMHTDTLKKRINYSKFSFVNQILVTLYRSFKTIYPIRLIQLCYQIALSLKKKT